MFVDLVGISSVSNIIEQSGLSKFTISKVNANVRSVPIFENLKCKNVRDAKQIFINWANSILSGNPQNCNEYELFLFDELENIEEQPEEEAEEVQTKNKRSKKKSDKIRFTFALCNPNQAGLSGTGGKQIDAGSIEEMINNAIKKRSEEETNNQILKRITDIENTLLEEEEEEEEIGESEVDKISALIDKISAISLMVKGKGNKALASVSGPVPDVTGETPIDMLNRAIKVLYKHNKNLHSDLLKLSEIAETQPDQFTFLLNALRNM